MNKILVNIFLAIFTFHSFYLIAQEGNYKFENFGNRSILLNGNVTGSVEDLGLTYYNPARLAVVEKTSFSINAKAYQYTTYSLKDGFGENQTLTDSNFEGIPSMVAGTFDVSFLKGEKFAYSLISKSRFNTSLSIDTGVIEADVLDGVEGDELFVGRLNLNNKVKDEWFGLTWGKSLSDNFSFGISAHFSVYEHTGSNLLGYASLDTNNEVAFYRNYVSFKEESYGLFFKAGLAWNVNDWELGLNVNIPYLELYGEGKLVYEEILAGIGPDSDRFTVANFKGIDADRKRPFGISAGAGIPIGKSMIHTNLEWHAKVKTYNRLSLTEDGNETTNQELPELNFDESLRNVINFGAGAEIYFSPKFLGYLSFSSDYSAFNKNANIFDLINEQRNDVNTASNYYHYGAGVDIKMKWASLILGVIYSRGKSKFERSLNFPNEDINDNQRNISRLQVERFRVIIGIDIPFVKKELEKLN